MIRSLILERFGKFRNKTFDLGQTTLFCGPNESGKSTIFEALFDALCRPKGNSKQGQELTERYSAQRKASLSFQDQEEFMDPVEFLNLYAIRNSQLEVASGDDWMQKVKNSLFSGGIDTVRISESLRSEFKLSGTVKFHTEYRKLKEQKTQLQRELEEKQAERQHILEREKLVAGDEVRVREKEQLIDQKSRAIAEIVTRLTMLEKKRERKNLLELLAVFSDHEALLEQREQLSRYSRDESSDYQRIEEDLAQHRRAMDMERGKQSEAAKARLEQENKLQQLRGDGEKARRLASEAERAISALNEQHNKPRSRKGLNLALAIPGILLALSGAIVPWLFLQDVVVNVAIAAGTVAAGAILFFLSLPKQNPKDSEESRLHHFKDDFKSRTGFTLTTTTYEAIVLELGKLVSEGATQTALQNDAELELTRRRELEAEILSNLETLQKNLTATEQTVREWLFQRGCATLLEYKQKCEQYRSVSMNIEKGTEDTTRILKQFSSIAGSARELKTELSRRIDLIDQTTDLDDEPVNEQEFTKLRNKREMLEQDIKVLERERGQLKEISDKQRGHIESDLGRIPEDIATLEQNIQDCGKKIADYEHRAKAAELAARLFRHISADAEETMTVLAQEISSNYGLVTGNDQSVQFQEFPLDSAAIPDAGGDRRKPALLSKGTKAAFWFAARLVLAGRTRGKNGLLVLDEPFESMDDGREKRALEMLAEFQKTQGWQILILSKEKRLEPAMKGLFENLKIHQLSSGE